MKNDGETTHIWYWIDYDGQSVIKNLAGAAGLVRGSLLFPCGNIVTNSSTMERPGAFSLHLLAFNLQIKCERIEGSNNSQKLQGEGIFSSVPVTRPEFQETRGDLK